MVTTKREDVIMQGFCKILWRKLRLRGSLLVLIQYFVCVGGVRWVGVGACFSLSGKGRGGRLFEAGCLLTFSASRMGAYSRWALIRGWALIRIHTVFFFRIFFITTLFVIINTKKAAIREELNTHVRWPPKNIYKAIKEI